MEELSLVNLEQTEITAWDFENLKKELSRLLSVYKTTVYTDDDIKLAKDDRAKLKKVKNIVEDQRKAFKKKCMEPYDAIEPKIKELVSMIEEQWIAINDVVKDYEDRQKEKKEAEVRAFYDKKSHELGELAVPIYKKIFDKKWLNSSSGKKYQEEIQTKINEVLADIHTLKELNSPFIDTVIEKYAATLSVDEAMAKHEELSAAVNRAGIDQQQNNPVVSESVKEYAIDTENGTLIKIYGSKKQIAQVMDFAKALGVKIEIQSVI